MVQFPFSSELVCDIFLHLPSERHFRIPLANDFLIEERTDDQAVSAGVLSVDKGGVRIDHFIVQPLPRPETLETGHSDEIISVSNSLLAPKLTADLSIYFRILLKHVFSLPPNQLPALSHLSGSDVFVKHFLHILQELLSVKAGVFWFLFLGAWFRVNSQVYTLD